MAIVQTRQGDQAKKIAVDLGRADRLKGDVTKGKQLTFSAFPVKVKDKPLMMARTVQMGDRTVQIDRQPNTERRQARKGS